MPTHIGQKIKEVLYNKRIKVSDFAKEINKSRNIVYNIFERETIDTGLLKKISEVLEHDFSQYYILEESVVSEYEGTYISRYNQLQEENSQKNKQIEEYKKEIEQLKKEIGYLKEIVNLLKQKK